MSDSELFDCSRSNESCYHRHECLTQDKYEFQIDVVDTISMAMIISICSYNITFNRDRCPRTCSSDMCACSREDGRYALTR